MVATPLGVEVGETLPHCETPHDTAQVTPLLDGSLFTVAVIETTPAACTVELSAETEIVIGATVIAGAPPPQPEMVVAKASPKSERAKDTVGFTCASAKFVVVIAADTQRCCRSRAVRSLFDN